MSAPQTNIYICTGVRLDNRYQHTIWFDSQSNQQKYFAGKVSKIFPAYSHHRRNWELKVEATVNDAQKWNYCYIVNPGVKPYYYFINKVEYVSDTTVKLWLELDVIQTNMFDLAFLPCFIERQHTPTDRPGEHTVAEGLELGPYRNYHIYDMDDTAEMGVLVLSSVDLTVEIKEGSPPPRAYGRNFNGVYSGLGVYAFESMDWLEQQLEGLDAVGMADAVVAIWMYPKKMLTLGPTDSSWSSINWGVRRCTPVSGVQWRSTTLAMYDNYSGSLFGGYEPKNKKLYTYPYNLLYATNNQGEKAEYRFEYFSTVEDAYMFRLYGAVSPDAGVKLCPDCYLTPGSNVNYDEGITLANFPPCAWDSDTYKVWLAQNYNQMKHAETSAFIGGLAGLGTMVGGLATGNLAMAGGGAVAAYGGFNQIGAIMAQKEDAKAQPPQAKGTHSTTVNVANGRQTFSFYYKSICKEYAQQIDDYFTMYGYKLNRVQKPNIHARPAFTFVKTVGCKMIGKATSNDDIVAIEQIFDNGITFWVDGDKLGDYSQNNSV